MINTKQEFRESNVLEGLKIGVHDIRSPITFLQVLQNSATNLSAREKDLLEIATERIIGVVESMANLLYANSENYAELNNIEPIKFSCIIEKIILEKKYEYSGLDVSFNYTPPVDAYKCLVYCESHDLERMLSNLLNNAVEACDDDCIINVSLKLNNNKLHLSIIDNGKGIPNEILYKLRNGVTVTSGKKNGQGIGFRQIRETVTKLGGSLAIHSTFGAGTEIQLILPLVSGNYCN